MKKILCVLCFLISLVSYCAGCNAESSERANVPVDDSIVNEKLRKEILEIESIEDLAGISYERLHNFSNKIMGEFEEKLDPRSIFPNALIRLFEKAVFSFSESSDEANDTFIELTSKLSKDICILSMEDIYYLFPEAYEHRQEFTDIFDAYEFVGGKYCESIFYFKDEEDTDCFVFVIDSGGSYGIRNVYFRKKAGEQLYEISSFETQNNGFGRVIFFDQEFYYVFMQYNYNLKLYDGVRIYRLGKNVDEENVLIQYLPKEYSWYTVFACKDKNAEKISDYIDEIKGLIMSSKYVENGEAKDIGLFDGDEKLGISFTQEELSFGRGIDICNTGSTIYIDKSNHIPSDQRSVWYFRAHFYIYDEESGLLLKPEESELINERVFGERIVQLWFKKINGKIYTFRLFIADEYNYILNVLILENGEVRQVRTDMICPQRHFLITEGKIYKYT